jgi:hypothetical protein
MARSSNIISGAVANQRDDRFWSVQLNRMGYCSIIMH